MNILERMLVAPIEEKMVNMVRTWERKTIEAQIWLWVPKKIISYWNEDESQIL